MADLRVAVLVVENDAKEKRVSLRFSNADDSMAAAFVLEAGSARRLANALLQGALGVESTIIRPGHVAQIGRT
jgi:hypothetical protein